MIRSRLPALPPTLACVDGEVKLDVERQATPTRAVLDTLEANYPMLRGRTGGHDTQQRRSLLRLLDCEENLFRELTGSIVSRVMESKLIVRRAERAPCSQR
jgi:molybdopterin synthase sulfur carrier subunit